MARATRVLQTQKVIQLERSAHTLSRFHEELRAMPASSRATRLIERNEIARIKIAEKLGELRSLPPLKRPLDVK